MLKSELKITNKYKYPVFILSNVLVRNDEIIVINNKFINNNIDSKNEKLRYFNFNSRL